MTPTSASASPPAPVPLAIARSMLSLGIDASFAFCMASASAGLPSTSPPPSFAATVIARASFVNSLPRRASTIAFLCLIPAHLECPAIAPSLKRLLRRHEGDALDRGDGAGVQRAGRDEAIVVALDLADAESVRDDRLQRAAPVPPAARPAPG